MSSHSIIEIISPLITGALRDAAYVCARRQIGTPANDNWANGWGKRILDVALALTALFVASPVLILVALAIKLDSRGPVFFRQARRGRRGRRFDILKFRTMTVREDGEDVVQACPNDARCTRVGAWLRAYSLDELPQFINVVRGEMSLVGPRPHACTHDAFYGSRIGHYGHRQVVKPGLTGWAQVNGLRGPTPTVDVMARRVDLDVWYAGHASLGLDLKILFRTPREILHPRNAL